MNIGDILTRKPTIYARCGFEDTEAVPCTVVYIHPQKRFYTVAFRAGNYTWRECFPLRRVSDSDAPERRKYEGRRNPRHYGRSI